MDGGGGGTSDRDGWGLGSGGEGWASLVAARISGSRSVREERAPRLMMEASAWGEGEGGGAADAFGGAAYDDGFAGRGGVLGWGDGGV